MLFLVWCWFWSWCLGVLGHAPCSCIACVFSRCAPNRVNSHQVVEIAGFHLNACPCVLETMIAVLTMSCFPHHFLALVLNSYSSGTSSHLSTGGSVHEQMRLYIWGKSVLAPQVQRWALSWPWLFRRKNWRHRLSLLSAELVRWQQSREVDEALGSVGKELKKSKSASMLLYKPVVHPCLTAVCG